MTGMLGREGLFTRFFKALQGLPRLIVTGRAPLPLNGSEPVESNLEGSAKGESIDLLKAQARNVGSNSKKPGDLVNTKGEENTLPGTPPLCPSQHLTAGNK